VCVCVCVKLVVEGVNVCAHVKECFADAVCHESWYVRYFPLTKYLHLALLQSFLCDFGSQLTWANTHTYTHVHKKFKLCSYCAV
jgi:hypothetical protein